MRLVVEHFLRELKSCWKFSLHRSGILILLSLLLPSPTTCFNPIFFLLLSTCSRYNRYWRSIVPFQPGACSQLMDSPNHKAYHLDEYIPRADKVSSSFPTSSFGKGSAMYNNNEGRQTGNSMYVMVPVPVPMGGQQNGGYGWNGPSFPVNHPSYGGSDWDSGHASSSRAALVPRRPAGSYRAYHEHRYRKNCCSCWRCAVRA